MAGVDHLTCKASIGPEWEIRSSLEAGVQGGQLSCYCPASAVEVFARLSSIHEWLLV